jgi:hypothetical protein
MTLAELISDFKNTIGPARENGSEVGNPGLKAWFNDAYMLAISAILDAYPAFFSKKVTTTMFAGQGEYEVPEDAEKITMVSVTYDGTNWHKALPLNRINQATDLVDTRSIDFHQDQPFYYRMGRYVGLLPVPEVTLSNALALWYSYTPAELSEDTDVPEIPRRFQGILKLWVRALYLDHDDQHVAAERMRQRFDASLERLVQQIVPDNTDEPNTVEITDDSQGLYIHEM